MCALLRRPRTVGVAVTGDPEEYVEEGSGVSSLSMGAPLGNMEGGSCTRDFDG